MEPFADKYSYYVPRFLPLPLAKEKNGDQQFWKEKFHAANEEAQLALMNGPVFSFLKAGDMDFLFFPLFPICSHQVLKVFSNAFPKMFPIAPGFYSIWFAQTSTPLYIN